MVIIIKYLKGLKDMKSSLAEWSILLLFYPFLLNLSRRDSSIQMTFKNENGSKTFTLIKAKDIPFGITPFKSKIMS